MGHFETKSITLVFAFAIIALLSIVISGAKTRSDMLTALDTYVESGKPNAELVSDFSSCLKRKMVVLPFRSVECGGELNSKYGPTSMHQIDAVVKSIGL